METKEVNDFRNTKPHNNQYIFAEIVESLKTRSAIANYLNISTKLVDIKLKEHGLTIAS